MKHYSGNSCRENEKLYPHRHCEPTGPRGARRDDRLREAIHGSASGQMDCFVACAPRNDDGVIVQIPSAVSASATSAEDFTCTAFSPHACAALTFSMRSSKNRMREAGTPIAFTT